ncbi:DUF87 domain-containing protein [Candidatus Micrarchaeota archaeon]|nr:DUF87 domain-containing protein [Candidatus Micrarchaeota archaeon]
MEVREMHLYSEKVEEEDVKNLCNRIVKTRFPILGFFDPSDILGINAFQLIIKRDNNTVRFYIKEKERLQNVSPLIFPFRLTDPSLLVTSSGSFFPFPKFYLINGGKNDLLDFILKEGIEQLTLNITKILGGFIVTGTAIDTKGRAGKVVITSPTKFLKINLEKNPSIYIELLEPLPKKMSTTSKFPIFEDNDMSLGVDNYDPFQHTLIAGTSGSGKSKALYVLLRALQAKYGNNVRVVVVDPHGEFAHLFPDSKIVNFIKNYVEPLDVGQEKSPMLTQLVSQLIASSIGQENKYSERVLFYATHLLTSINKLELNNISALLTDSSIKAEYVSMCDNDEVKRFFDEEYNDIHIHHFNNAILPILNFIGEYQLYLGKEKVRESLLDSIKQNKMTVISFDPKFFGRRMISFLAGAIINQMYILAITGKLQDKPTIMVVDEFPRVETRVTKDILAETRKFNLFAYLSCQYLGQLTKEVNDSIVSNIRNIIAFKINKQDATMLSSIMEIKVEEYFKKSRSTTELEESKKEMFVRLHQRECIVRLFDGVKYLLPMKLRIVDAQRWGLKETFDSGHAADAGTPTEPRPDIQPKPSNEQFIPNYSGNYTGNYTGNDPNKQNDKQNQKSGLDEPKTKLIYATHGDEGPHQNNENGANTTTNANGENNQANNDAANKNTTNKDQPKEEAPKPIFPDPINENELLQETPDVIYKLGKMKMDEKKSKEAQAAKEAASQKEAIEAQKELAESTPSPKRPKETRSETKSNTKSNARQQSKAKESKFGKEKSKSKSKKSKK